MHLPINTFFHRSSIKIFDDRKEAARKDYRHPSDEVVESLVEEYTESVAEYDVTCCHQTCGNPLLKSYMEGILTGTVPEKASSSSTSKGGESNRHPYPQDRPSSVNANQTRSSSIGTAISEKPELVEETTESAEGEVSGFVMENVMEENSMPSISGAPLVGLILVLFILLVIGAGFRRR